MTYKKWHNQLDSLTKELLPCLREFRRDDPFSFCMKKRLHLIKHIESFADSRKRKSLEISSRYLREGNDRSESDEEKFSSYTQSIFYAPKDSPHLATAYVKRSELLRDMGHIKESKNDAEMALKCYVNNINISLEDVKSMLNSGEIDEAEKLLNDALKKTKLPEEEGCNVKNEILNLLRTIDVYSTQVENEGWNLPALKDGENPYFPSSSNSISVEYSETKGRYVTARCDIKMGDVLFVEKPFSFVVLKSYCNDCCGSSAAYIPCIYCLDMQYCCEDCRENAWNSYHKYECGFVDFLKDTGIAHLALRTMMQAGSDIDELRKVTGTLREKRTNTNTVFSKLIYENVYNLVSHSERMATEDFLQYSLTALLLSLYLTHFTNYAIDSEENVQFCAEIILLHITQLISNAHSITVINTDSNGAFSTTSEVQEQIGSAIYPSVSIMNHSCEPSVINTFHKNNIIVRAWKNIKMGEEVFNSYGIDCRRMQRLRRRDLLKTQYFFDCRCGPCSEDFDRYDILNSMKCGQCKGPLVEVTNKPRLGYKTCLFCSNREIINEEKLQMERRIGELLKQGEYTLYEENDVSEALQTFLKAWKLSRKIFFSFHKDLSYSANEIAHCLFLLRDYERCIKFMTCCVVCVEGRFGLYSSELAFEARKLSDVIRFYFCTIPVVRYNYEIVALKCKGFKYSDISEKVLRLLYGEDHPIVCDIKENKLYFR